MAAIYNLTGSSAIERGACYSFSMDLSFSTGEFVLSGYAVSGFLRRKWDNSVGPDFNTTITSENSGIASLYLSEAQTSALTIDEYNHEVYLYPPLSGCPTRILEGDVEVKGGGAI